MRVRVSIAAAIAAASLPAPASAGVYQDALTKCLIDKSSDADKALLVQWMFVALGAHPAVKDMVSFTQAERDDRHRRMAAMFQRLLTSVCRAETIAAVKFESSKAIGASFDGFGQAAAVRLMSDATVEREIGRFADFLDPGPLGDVLKEGGVGLPEKTPAK